MLKGLDDFVQPDFVEPEPCPGSATLTTDDARSGEHLQVVTDRRLGKTEGLGELADAGFEVGAGFQEVENLQPGRIGDRLEGCRKVIGTYAIEPAAFAQSDGSGSHSRTLA